MVDAIICINLKRRNDRRAHMLKELCKLSCKNIHFLEAVDASIWGINPRRAILLSHLRAIRLSRDAKYKRILVVEDDIIIHSHTQMILDKTIPKLPQKMPESDLKSVRHVLKKLKRYKKNGVTDAQTIGYIRQYQQKINNHLHHFHMLSLGNYFIDFDMNIYNTIKHLDSEEICDRIYDWDKELGCINMHGIKFHSAVANIYDHSCFDIILNAGECACKLDANLCFDGGLLGKLSKTGVLRAWSVFPMLVKEMPGLSDNIDSGNKNLHEIINNNSIYKKTLLWR